ncbi:ABC transporter substrate-binding protein [Methanocella conradii]|uniref:ABC transporter substrate-binding protein n=1 Tax=Methanocella conradii TaxID=1175444 RepID=UPI001C2CC69E|nr:ABC transporter substrate-binding protein [Methanocella conradii]
MGHYEKAVSILLSIIMVFSFSFATAIAGSPEKVWISSWGASGGDWGFPSPFAFYPRGPGYTMMSFCFDTLIWPNQTGDFVGLLAKSWESTPDGLTWTFHLRDNVKWHDGTPFKASDVVFTYNYIKDKSAVAPVGAGWYDTSVIKSITAKDDYTVTIMLTKPYAPFISQVAAVIPIVPEHIWKNVSEPAKYTDKKAAIGTGPFILEDYSPDQQSYKYAANKDYYLGKPAIDTLMFVKSADPVISLKKGDIDEAGLTYDQVLALNDTENIKIVSGDGYWVYRLRFNLPNNTILNDTNVRKAIYYALNCDDIQSKVLHGGGIPGNPGYVPPYSEWYNPNVTQYPYDPAKANQMLDAAGYGKRDADGIRLTPDGKRLEFQLLYTSDSQTQRIAELIQSYLKAVGIDITFKPGDMKTVDGLVGAGNFEMAIYSHGTSTDPARMLNGFPTSTGWNDLQFNALAKQQVSAVDEKERKALVDRMQGLIADNVPTIPLLYRNVYTAFNKDKFDGFFFTPGGIGGGVPTEYNKLVFVYGTWKETTASPSTDGVPFMGGLAALGIAASAMLFWGNRKK